MEGGGGATPKQTYIFVSRGKRTFKALICCLVFLVGPSLPEGLDVREIPMSKMRDLTINLSGKQLSFQIKDFAHVSM